MTVKQLRDHPSYQGAKCKRGKLCDFNVVFHNHEVQKERCSLCGKDMIYNVIDGKIDQAKYGRDHVRDFLQPGGQAYEEIYGSSWRKRKPHEKSKPTQQAIYEEAMDTAKTLSRMEGKGHKIDSSVFRKV
jgi:hypothetical protein